MPKLAKPEDYSLKVSIGSDNDPSKMVQINPNDEHRPFYIDNEFYCGYILVRMLNYPGMVPEGCERIANPPSNYFHGRNRRYSIMFQGKFKQDWNGDDIIFGTDFDEPVRMPTGIGIAVKIAQWLDPNIQMDLYSKTPYMFSPLLCAMNYLSVFDPSDPELQDPEVNTEEAKPKKKGFKGFSLSKKKESEKVASPTEKITSPRLSDTDALLTEEEKKMFQTVGRWSFHSRNIPENISTQVDEKLALTYDKRKKYFSEPKKRQAYTIHKDLVYCMDYYDAYLDMYTLSVRLPGFNLSVFKYWDDQPLRLSARTKDGKIKFFVIRFEWVPNEQEESDGEFKDAVED